MSRKYDDAWGEWREEKPVMTPRDEAIERVARTMWAASMRIALPHEDLTEAALDLGWRTMAPFGRGLWHEYAAAALTEFVALVPEVPEEPTDRPWTARPHYLDGYSDCRAKMLRRVGVE